MIVSRLDFKTDAKLREALKAETTEAVTLIVAQRITSVVNSDQIIVMNEGEIAGMGTHEELKESNQIYQEIMRSQLSERKSHEWSRSRWWHENANSRQTKEL
ncbi:hypothetical protein GCM10027614_85250 [Micromonospora vulcania]